MTGRAVWKSKNSSGSIVAKRSALSCAPMKVSAADAASPASFQPLNAHTSAGARSPSGRRSQISGCIRFTVHDGLVAPAGTTEPTISALRAGDEIDAVFACTRKDRLMARSGSPYLALELRDRSGAIPARAFRDADVLAGRFERGDLVRVAGRVDRFRDELQVEVRSIARAPEEEADPAAFLPTAYRDLDELEGFLEHLAREVHDAAAARDARARCSATPSCARRCAARPARARATTPTSAGCWSTRSRSRTLAHDLCQLHPRLDSDLLITAAIVHDLGKTREFTYGAEIGLTDEGRLLGPRRARAADPRAARRAALGDERRLALLHCVLCHHGADAAPGRRFGSAEALALYRLNALDASVKGAFEQGL